MYLAVISGQFDFCFRIHESEAGMTTMFACARLLIKCSDASIAARTSPVSLMKKTWSGGWRFEALEGGETETWHCRVAGS